MLLVLSHHITQLMVLSNDTGPFSIMHKLKVESNNFGSFKT